MLGVAVEGVLGVGCQPHGLHVREEWVEIEVLMYNLECWVHSTNTVNFLFQM